jgi:deazaflavin-dependent oxidoreductase (nitroreductase family)
MTTPSDTPTSSGSPGYLPAPWLHRRILNPLVMRLGMRPTFAVRGRKTGRERKVPVRPIEVGGNRYLVAKRGHSQWARNLRVNPEAELRHRGNAERIRAIEIDGTERDRAFAEYRATADPSIKTLLDQLPDPAGHATFRIETLPRS